MVARDPRLRGVRALGPAAVIAAALLAAGIAPPVSYAQTAPELERAKDLYLSAEAAMKDGRFDDATRDYGASYELSKDPALFFKIGRANERAARCDIALIYYARYLREGKPTEQFVGLTNERIAACHGSVPGAGSNPAGSGTAAGTGSAANAGVTGEASAGSAAAGSAAADSAGETSAGAGSGIEPSIGGAGSGSAAEPAVRGASPEQRSPTARSTTAPEATAPPDPAPAGSGSAAPLPIPSNQHKVAWLLGGSAIALATLGGVLAYAARSSENDVRDLYAGLAGQPPPYDSQTRKRYDDLVDDGHRFQHLSWTAFGFAGAATVGAALLFTLGGDEAAPHARVTPVITPRGGGIAVRF
jgi:hypothetical protein